jgi:hypothetical protein
VEKAEYANARAQLADYARLDGQLQNYRAEEAYIQDSSLKYSAILYQLSRGLLKGAEIYSVRHEEGSDRMQITFTTRDVNGFLETKEEMNAEGNMRVVDAVVIDVLGEGLWRCGIVVSWNADTDGEVSE